MAAISLPNVSPVLSFRINFASNFAGKKLALGLSTWQRRIPQITLEVQDGSKIYLARRNRVFLNNKISSISPDRFQTPFLTLITVLLPSILTASEGDFSIWRTLEKTVLSATWVGGFFSVLSEGLWCLKHFPSELVIKFLASSLITRPQPFGDNSLWLGTISFRACSYTLTHQKAVKILPFQDGRMLTNDHLENYIILWVLA